MKLSDFSVRSLSGGIFICTAVFLLTLTNSIFLNQVGYYGALIFLLVSWGKSRKNPFSKNGLELFFLLFLATELISAIGSLNQPQAFNNVLKRALLIPLVYVFAAIPRDEQDVKDLVHLYFVAAITVTLIYLGASYRYVVLNLYQVTESGPDLFQYPITTSELLLFAIILSFALFTGKGESRKMRALYLCVSLVSFIGLLATFKRTGLIGAAAGIFVVLFLRNKKFALVPIVLIGAFIPFSGKDSSTVTLMKISNNKAEVINTFTTGGRATWTETDSTGTFYVADYEGGLLKLRDGALEILPVAAPLVQRIYRGTGNTLLLWLADSRVLSYKEGMLPDSIRSYLSPGLTADMRVKENRLAVLDKDSGLTLFSLAGKDSVPVRISPEGPNERVYFTGEGITIIGKQGGLYYYAKGTTTPVKLVPETKFTFSASTGDKLLLNSGNNILAVSTAGGKYNVVSTLSNIPHPAGWCADAGSGLIYIYTLEGSVYRIDSSLTRADLLVQLPFQPRSISASGDSIMVTNYTRSRISSITDPFNPSNLSRVALWRAGFKINADYPWFGVGDIDLGKLFKQYKRPYDKEIQGHMHNNYIHFLVILGRVGLAVVLLLIVSIFVRTIKALRLCRGSSFAESYIIGFAGAFTAFLTAGLTEWNFGDHEIITMVWFTLGLVFALQRLNKEQHSSTE